MVADIRDLFQYISCYSLSSSPLSVSPMYPVFQYISCYSLSEEDLQKMHNYFVFQYISCYSLSQRLTEDHSFQICFNTSHVTLYHHPVPSCCLDTQVSIHLMLLFISPLSAAFSSQMQFQYISCYSLSSGKSFDKCRTSAFQYISCYSLSEHKIEMELNGWKFQYISCYSLSNIHSLHSYHI